MVRSLEWTAPRRVREAVASLGRTEDVCFSSDDRRLAVAAFARNRITVFDVELSSCGDGVHVGLTGGVEISSPALRGPHGLDFLDEDTLIVTNRLGTVCLFALPPGTCDLPHYAVLPIATWPSAGSSLLRAPGSVCASRLDDGGHEILVCDNTGHTVTRYRLDSRHTVQSSDVLLRKWLDVPDGVSRSRDGRWVAVSNHVSHQVFLYDESSPLHENADPAGILRGMTYPHGLRFSPDGRHLFLADAGAPYVHVYSSDRDEWRGVRYPVASLRIMDDKTFMGGRHNSQEGGPKGIALDNRARVLIVTSECQPLACFDASELLGLARSDRSAREQQHIAIATELDLLTESRYPDKTARETAAMLDYMKNSLSWRLTAPLRRLDSVLRRRG